MLNFHKRSVTRQFVAAGMIVLASGTVMAVPAMADAVIANDLNRCDGKSGSAVLVTVQGVTAATGKIRVQSYPATVAAWLEKGQWLSRIEQRPAIGDMQFCIPVAKAGNYAIAVRHDKNGNGKTDLSGDGGGFSQNPKISTFRAILGKSVVPVKKASFYAGPGVTRITIAMRYR